MAATEYRADVVITLTDGHAPILAVVVEAQLRIDTRKRRSWPADVATLHARLGCPVMLLVVCPDPAVATWCAIPIVVSNPGLVLTPLVLGPGQVPAVTDAGSARRSPELAVLSALAHGREPDQREVFEAFLAALEVVDQDHANLSADVVLAVLPAAAREYLEALMTTDTHRYQSDFARRYYDQGWAEGEAQGEARGEAHGQARGEARGKAKAVLAVLDARGIEVPDEVRTRIAACTDLDQLDTWILHAVTASKVHELFD